MKKILSILLVLAMVLSLGVSAFALADEESIPAPGAVEEPETSDTADAEEQPLPVSVKLSADGTSAAVENYRNGLYARIALVLDYNGESGLFVTQGAIRADGVIAIPAFSVPGLTVKGVHVAIVDDLAHLTAASFTPVDNAADSLFFPDDSTTEFVILHTNDTHGAIEGFPYLKTLKDYLVDEGSNVLLFDAGDTFYGENVATFFAGQSIAEAMESVHYDAMVLGNDDTTKGSSRQAEIAAYLSFPVLAANYTDLDGNPVVEDCTVIESNGYRFGVFGVTALVGADQAERMGGYTTDSFAAAAACVEKLKAADVDVIIGLTHLGVGTEHAQDGAEALAAAVPGIDIIIDGHSHTELPEGIRVGDTLIVQTGEHFHNIGRIDLQLNADGSIASAEASLIPAEEFMALEPDAATQSIADSWLEKVNAYTSEVLCEAPYRLNADRPDIRCKETNLGNLVADALVSRTGADMALVPGFFIRKSVEAGDFTRGDVLNVLANGGDFIVYRATGEYIRDLMEQCLSAVPQESGGPTGFRHVSGIAIEFDSSKDAGERIVSITLDNGDPLDPDAEYTFASGTAIALEDERIEQIGAGDDLQSYMMEYLASGDAVITEGPVGRLHDLNAD